MKRLFLTFLLLLVTISCVGSRTQPVNLPEQLSNETVALVTIYPQDPEQLYRSYCTGVFISPTKILTAHHCALSEDNESSVGKLVKFKLYQEVDTRKNILKDSEPHFGLVQAEDLEADLAVISTIDPLPTHGYAEVSKNVPSLGEQLFIVGHPANLKYTFLLGWVASYRDKGNVPYLQINSAAYRGNSGGGAFNAKGELVGICTLLYALAPNELFFVDTTRIQKLLDTL